jgi:hypothetical protein
MENFVVANDPGRECGQQSERCRGAGQHPGATLSVTPVAGPRSQERHDGKRNGLDERGETSEQAEANPVKKPSGIFEL